LNEVIGARRCAGRQTWARLFLSSARSWPLP
jgi:hypothetical protein